MNTPTTSLRRAPAPTLTAALTLALTLTGCGGTPPDAPTPPPDAGPAAPQAQPLVPLPNVEFSGEGSYVQEMLSRIPTYASCKRVKSCVAWTAPLPAPPPGYALRVSPVLQIPYLAGGPVITSNETGKECEESLLVQALVATDLDPKDYVREIAAPLVVPAGATRLVARVCAFGGVQARIVGLTGTITFIPTPAP